MNLPVLLLLLSFLLAHGRSLAAPPKPPSNSKSSSTVEQLRSQINLLQPPSVQPELRKELDKLQAELADRNVPSEATNPAEHHAHQAHQAQVNQAFWKVSRTFARNPALVAHLSNCLGISADRLSGWMGHDSRLAQVFFKLCKQRSRTELYAQLRAFAKGSTDLPGQSTPLSKAYVYLLMETLEDDGCIDRRLFPAIAEQLNLNWPLAEALERASTDLFGMEGYEFVVFKLQACNAEHGWDDRVPYNLR